MKWDASQQRAIEAACTSRFAIVTGGAGSGKTTLIKEIATRLQANGETVALCAFAGKAAARLREATGFSASTIHRMLGFNGTAFRLDTLEGQSVIMDEASMVDASLLAEVVQRNPDRLILVGDPAQLPPVGRGQPFHDIIKLRPECVSTLTTCYRAREAVFQAANDIRAGNRPPTRLESPGEKWTMRNTGDADSTQTTILQWIAAGMIDFTQDIILVARNGDLPDEPCTVKGLNKAIADMLRPRDEGVPFVVGDRVINTKNLPDLDCWNGTTGTVHAIDIDGGIWIDLDVPAIIDGRPTNKVLFAKDKRKHLELAYALTTHKSQGSQYRRVILAAFQRDTWGLLDRSLTYTAVTRTKQACCVVGELGAIWKAIDRVNSKRTAMQVVAQQEERTP